MVGHDNRLLIHEKGTEYCGFVHVDCLFDYGVSIYRPAGGYTVAYAVSVRPLGQVELLGSCPHPSWRLIEATVWGKRF